MYLLKYLNCLVTFNDGNRYYPQRAEQPRTLETPTQYRPSSSAEQIISRLEHA